MGSRSFRWGLGLIVVISACAESRERDVDAGVDAQPDAILIPDAGAAPDAWTPDAGPCGDRDDDGVCDALDVCPDVADPAQIDVDGDGIGWKCDTLEELGIDGSNALTAFRGDYFAMLTTETPAGLVVVGPDHTTVDRNFGRTVPWANRVDVIALDAEGRVYFFVRGTPPDTGSAAILRMSDSGIETLSRAAFDSSTSWQVWDGPGARFISGTGRSGVARTFTVDAIDAQFPLGGGITDATNPTYAYASNESTSYVLTDRIETIDVPGSFARWLWGGTDDLHGVRGPVFACSDNLPYLMRGREALRLGVTRECGHPLLSWSGGYVTQIAGELVELGIGTERTLTTLGSSSSSPGMPFVVTTTGVSRLEGHDLVSVWEADPGSGSFAASSRLDALATVQRGETGPWTLHVRGPRSYDATFDPEYVFFLLDGSGNALLRRGADFFVTSDGALRPIESRSMISTGYSFVAGDEVLVGDLWVPIGTRFDGYVGPLRAGSNATQCALSRIDGRPEFGPRVDHVVMPQPCIAGAVFDSVHEPVSMGLIHGDDVDAFAIVRPGGESEIFTLTPPRASLPYTYSSRRAVFDSHWVCELEGHVRCWPHDNTDEFSTLAEGAERDAIRFLLRGPRGLAVLRHFGPSQPPPGHRIFVP